MSQLGREVVDPAEASATSEAAGGATSSFGQSLTRSVSSEAVCRTAVSAEVWASASWSVARWATWWASATPAAFRGLGAI